MSFIADYWNFLGPVAGFGLAWVPAAYRTGKAWVEKAWKKLP